MRFWPWRRATKFRNGNLIEMTLSDGASVSDDWGVALRYGEAAGTAEIVFRADGEQQAVISLGRHAVLKWAARRTDIAARAE